MTWSQKILLVASLVTLPIAALLLISGCGRAPATLLRQGQSPVFDFPLYVTEGAPGRVVKYESDQTKTIIASGLSDPRGIATDKFNNLYVVEQGLGQLIKINTKTNAITTLVTGLSIPTVVAVDSFGEAYVAQEGTFNILRASDQKIMATFASRPTALAFGVDDIMIVGLFDANTVQWGVNGQTTTVSQPVNISTDSTGRVYVAEGVVGAAQVIRYHQRKPSGRTIVADSLTGPSGIAVDPVGNIYLVEQGAGRIDLVTHDGKLYNWIGDLIDPQYLAFTQY